LDWILNSPFFPLTQTCLGILYTSSDSYLPWPEPPKTFLSNSFLFFPSLHDRTHEPTPTSLREGFLFPSSSFTLPRSADFWSSPGCEKALPGTVLELRVGLTDSLSSDPPRGTSTNPRLFLPFPFGVCTYPIYFWCFLVEDFLSEASFVEIQVTVFFFGWIFFYSPPFLPFFFSGVLGDGKTPLTKKRPSVLRS